MCIPFSKLISFCLGGITLVDKNIGTLSTVKVNKCDDLYKVVTILNKTLKERDLMFGLALDEEEKEKMIFTIYET